MGVPTYFSKHVPQQSQEGGHGPHSNMLPSSRVPQPEDPSARATSVSTRARTSAFAARSATKGTAFYRLRTAAGTVSLIVTLLAHGCPLQAIVIAFGFDERTVARWGMRTGIQGQAVRLMDINLAIPHSLLRGYRLKGRV
jgi:hypothetical protein